MLAGKRASYTESVMRSFDLFVVRVQVAKAQASLRISAGSSEP